MHELAITQSLVDAVCEHTDGAPIVAVNVRVGRLSGVVPDAMRFCFELITEGTPMQGARLEIEEPAGRARCRNIFLGDDGFGSEVARRLTGRTLPTQVRVVDYGIRGMHLAYDLLDGYAALVLIDALPGRGEPGDITVLEVGPDDLGTGVLDAHGMDPVAVLGSLDGLGGELPRTYVVGCTPLDVGDGIGLTAPVEGAVDSAVEIVCRLVGELAAEQPEPVRARQDA